MNVIHAHANVYLTDADLQYHQGRLSQQRVKAQRPMVSQWLQGTEMIWPESAVDTMDRDNEQAIDNIASSPNRVIGSRVVEVGQPQVYDS